MICIVCPVGCELNVKVENENISVTGNKCPRGEVYAKEEIFSPKRVVTATMKIDGTDSSNNNILRLPVKTSSPCPKEKIPELLDDIYKIMVSLPVNVGDVIINNWNNSGIDVISTRKIF